MIVATIYLLVFPWNYTFRTRTASGINEACYILSDYEQKPDVYAIRIIADDFYKFSPKIEKAKLNCPEPSEAK